MNAILKNPLALAGLIVIGFISIMAILAPLIAPFDPDAMVLDVMFTPECYLAHAYRF